MNPKDAPQPAMRMPEHPNSATHRGHFIAMLKGCSALVPFRRCLEEQVVTSPPV